MELNDSFPNDSLGEHRSQAADFFRAIFSQQAGLNALRLLLAVVFLYLKVGTRK